MNSRRWVVALVIGVVAVGIAVGMSDWRVPRNVAAKAELIALADGRVPKLGLVEEARVDGNADSLGKIGWVTVGPTGTIVFTDGDIHALRFHTPEGGRFATVGRRGEGPLEFSSFTKGGWVGDSLWIWDTQLDRVTMMTGRGEYLADEKIRMALPGPSTIMKLPTIFVDLRLEAITPDGEFLVRGKRIGATSWDSVTAIVSLGSIGVIHRVVAELRDPDETYLHFQGRGFGMSAPVPFAATRQTHFDPDGRRIGTVMTRFHGSDSGSIDLTILSHTGDTTVHRVYPFHATPIPQRVIDSTIEATRVWLSTTRYPPEARDYILDAVPAKMKHPYAPVTGLRLGRDSSIWLGLRPTAIERSWLVLDGRGDPLGIVTLPRRVSVEHVSATHVWILTADEDGVPSVIRYRLEGLPASG